jgi:hypothetical protein
MLVFLRLGFALLHATVKLANTAQTSLTRRLWIRFSSREPSDSPEAHSPRFRSDPAAELRDYAPIALDLPAGSLDRPASHCRGPVSASESVLPK